MVRPGRKRKYKGVLPPEKTRRKPLDDPGTPESIRRRIEAVGVEHANRREAGDALGVLMLAGIITERHRAAGAEYARLRSAVIGSPHCEIADYERSVKGTSGTGDGAKTEAQWRSLVKNLSLGEQTEIDIPAVYNIVPEWFWRRNRPKQEDRVKQALLVSALTKIDG